MRSEFMRLTKWMALPAAVGLTVLVGSALAVADATVEIKGVHLCCGACVKGVGAALKGVDGATPKCDQKAKTVTITAKDDATAQKAVDALTAAGYHGDVSSAGVSIKETTGIPKGNVKSLSLGGIHNCCGACTKAIKAALKGVEGVKADTAKAKLATLEVRGDFDAGAVIKALNAAGFHPQVSP
jgi:copper chaperone CopZ